MDGLRLTSLACALAMGLSGAAFAQDPLAEAAAATQRADAARDESADPSAEPSVDPTADRSAEPADESAAMSAEVGDATSDTADSADPSTAAGSTGTVGLAQDVAPLGGSVPAASVDLSDIMAMLTEQKTELAAQRKLIESQGKIVDGLRGELDALRAPAVVEDGSALDAAPAPLPTVAAAPTAADDDAGTDADGDPSRDEKIIAKAGVEGLQASQDVTEAQTDDPTLQSLDDFVGAWRLPGTSAALRIGGYVKATVVNSFDPLATTDRFIVGSIPVGASDLGVEAQSSITANQSRLNFDLREPTDGGLLRAFIEGDFAEDNDTFRLRHAFGQWRRVLAGKTWSAFVDTQATPEEIDFEGLNGRINVRQSQVRLMPRIGSAFEFQVSLEDPDAEIENGEGVSQIPDIVASGRFNWGDDLHVKVGTILRQIRGQWDDNVGNTEKDVGWGVTISGRFDTPIFDARDSVLFQLNRGEGIGRYVNDLKSIGDFDARFDPVTGELELIEVLSGYISAQHYWGDTLRSNLTIGYVDVDYSGFVESTDYQSTVRASGNVFWSPTPRIDLGGELLWGRRENQDGENGDATQVQFAAKYRF